MSTRKGLFNDLRLALLLLVAVLCIFVYRYLSFVYTPLLHGKSAQIYLIQPGTNLKTVIYSLKDRGWVRHAYFYYLFARWHGFHDTLRYGEYKVSPRTSTLEFLTEMSESKNLMKRSIRLGEGWTFSMMRRALNYEHRLRHLLRGKTDAEVMALLGHPTERPEGRFFPDTYYFTWGNTDLSILKTAYQKMQQHLTAVNKPYRTLIIASMVEKESAVESERPMIAGVIENRLRKRIPLQIDATVRYAVKKAPGVPLSKRDLKTASPYNTYLNYALPPTPIAAPSESALEAAAHPKRHHYFYYVAQGEGEGEAHRFSSNYQDHLLAVKQYRRHKAEQVSWHYSYRWDSDRFFNVLMRIHSYLKWIDLLSVGIARGNIF